MADPMPQKFWDIFIGGGTPAPPTGQYYYPDGKSESSYVSSTGAISGYWLGDIITVPAGTATKLGVKVNDSSNAGDVKIVLRQGTTNIATATVPTRVDGALGWYEVTINVAVSAGTVYVLGRTSAAATGGLDTTGRGYYNTGAYADGPNGVTQDDEGYKHSARVWVE